MSVKISEDEWRRIIEAYNPEKFTVVEYCNKLNISKSHFYYYRDKFRHQNCDTVSFVPVKIATRQNLSFSVNIISMKVDSSIDDISLKRLIDIYSQI